MTKFLKLAALSLLALHISLASAAPPYPTKYQTLHIAEVEMITPDLEPSLPDQVEYYSDMQKKSRTLLVDQFRAEGFSIEDVPPAENSALLIIKTKVVFVPGVQALRWAAGMFGAGKATADITVEAVDSATGQVVATTQNSSVMRVAGLGGSAEAFLMGALDTVWNSILVEIYKLH
jgi:hypothetical protein